MEPAISLAPLPGFELIADLSVNIGKWMHGMSERLEAWVHIGLPRRVPQKFATIDADRISKTQDGRGRMEVGSYGNLTSTSRPSNRNLLASVVSLSHKLHPVEPRSAQLRRKLALISMTTCSKSQRGSIAFLKRSQHKNRACKTS